MLIPTAKPDRVRRVLAFLSLALAALGACAADAPPGGADPLEARRHEVSDTERAFAQTMARRDFNAFSGFLSPEAVFFSDGRATRGSAAVAALWKPLYEGAKAPFSWEPEQVEVLDSGELALSTGPVRDAEGKIVGSFSSIWRREASGAWRIVFDKGCNACNCSPSSQAK